MNQFVSRKWETQEENGGLGLNQLCFDLCEALFAEVRLYSPMAAPLLRGSLQPIKRFCAASNMIDCTEPKYAR